MNLDYFLETWDEFTNKIPKFTKWQKRAIMKAKMHASFSKDPSTRVGAAIVYPKGKKFAGFGFNGFPEGVDDSLITNRDFKIACILHAEENALDKITTPLDGCAAYVWALPSCGHCMSKMAQRGISKVVCIQEKDREDWRASFAYGRKIAWDTNITYEVYKVENIDPLLKELKFPNLEDD